MKALHKITNAYGQTLETHVIFDGEADKIKTREVYMSWEDEAGNSQWVQGELPKTDDGKHYHEITDEDGNITAIVIES